MTAVLTHRYKRIFSPPRDSFFLFGPRGTGKSTWIKDHFKAARRFDLLDESLFQSLVANPSLLAGELRSAENGTPIVLDEVQRVPALLNIVHQFIEDRKLRFVLCGSSARKLKQVGTNLLAGRAIRCEMFPLVPEELGDDFDLMRTLQYGTLPLVLASADRRATLESYVQTYLKTEIQAEAVVKNLPAFFRFFPIAALMNGQLLSITTIAREAEVARTTVNGYVEILEDTLLAFRLEAFEPQLRLRERKHPKLYWIDNGIVRAIRKRWHPPGQEELGHLFEAWIASTLRAYQSYTRLFDEFWYWAPAEAKETEVDFILRKDDRYVAIEAKATSKIHDRLFSGLRAIGALKGLTRRVMVYLGERPLKTEDGIDVLPVRKFLQLISSGELWKR